MDMSLEEYIQRQKNAEIGIYGVDNDYDEEDKVDNDLLEEDSFYQWKRQSHVQKKKEKCAQLQQNDNQLRQKRTYINYDEPDETVATLGIENNNCMLDDDIVMQNLEDNVEENDESPILYTKHYDLRQKINARSRATKRNDVTSTILVTRNYNDNMQIGPKNEPNGGKCVMDQVYHYDSNVQKRLKTAYQTQYKLPFSQRIHNLINAEEADSVPLEPKRIKYAETCLTNSPPVSFETLSAVNANSLSNTYMLAPVAVSMNSPSTAIIIPPQLGNIITQPIANMSSQKTHQLIQLRAGASADNRNCHQIPYNMVIQKEIAKIQNGASQCHSNCKQRKFPNGIKAHNNSRNNRMRLQDSKSISCPIEPDTTGIAINNRFSLIN